MKISLTLLLASLICPSCNPKSDSPHPASIAFKSSGAAAFREDEFSDWMTKAEQQVSYEKTPPGHYFAYTEGRNCGGLNQYRHILRPAPLDQFSEWAVYWGLSADEFYQLDLKLLKTGYARQHLQVFMDGQGAAFHQAVWLKAKPDSNLATPTSITPAPR